MLARIEKDIQDIQQAIADVSGRIDKIHLEYAQAIAKAVQQQVLLAAFKFCTQSCPTAFLALSLSERQKLQEHLRQKIKTLSEEMQQVLEQCDRRQRDDQDNLDTLLGNCLDATMAALNQLLVEHKILESLETATDKTKDKTKEQNNQKPSQPKMSIRLAEIEFTDRYVMSYRGELRVLSARLSHLHNELDKKYHQKTIAEAELAWRSAWVE
jgi:hypothetical protein